MNIRASLNRPALVRRHHYGRCEHCGGSGRIKKEISSTDKGRMYKSKQCVRCGGIGAKY